MPRKRPSRAAPKAPTPQTPDQNPTGVPGIPAGPDGAPKEINPNGDPSTPVNAPDSPVHTNDPVTGQPVVNPGPVHSNDPVTGEPLPRVTNDSLLNMLSQDPLTQVPLSTGSFEGDGVKIVDAGRTLDTRPIAAVTVADTPEELESAQAGAQVSGNGVLSPPEGIRSVQLDPSITPNPETSKGDDAPANYSELVNAAARDHETFVEARNAQAAKGHPGGGWTGTSVTPIVGGKDVDGAVKQAEGKTLDGEILKDVPGTYSYQSRIQILDAYQYTGTVHDAPDWVDRNWTGYGDYDNVRLLEAGPVLRVPDGTGHNGEGVVIARKGDFIVRQSIENDDGSPAEIRVNVWAQDQFMKLFMPKAKQATPAKKAAAK